MTNPEFSRRGLGGVTLLGVATPLLVACGADEPSSSPTSGDTASNTPVPDASSSTRAGGEEVLVAASAVPVGGGVVVEGPKVVVTQPAEGTFRCFTAICTHQGCLVTGVEERHILCPCHGSVFSADDGSVVDGPARAPLEEFPVTVADGQVTRA